MVVFDFDKTLTNKDTLYGYYQEVDGEHPYFLLKRLALLFAAILYKIGLIHNTRLKKIGVFLFLRNKSLEEIQKKAVAYASRIKLNTVYYEHFLAVPLDKRMIISASPDIYLSTLFPEEMTTGTSLRFTNGKVAGLKQNMYGKEKVRALQRKGIYQIECLYTDSYSDKPLMVIAEQVRLVKNGKVTLLI